MFYSHDKTSFENQENVTVILNPLSPYDAFKHHFTSLKTHLIFLQGVLK